MLVMRLAFYRGPGNWITWAIRLLTWGPFSHVELVFPNGDCFSSSGRYGASGVRYTRVTNLNDEDYWTVFPLEGVTSEQQAAAREFIAPLLGLQFDWRGLLSFLFPPLGAAAGRWYCSNVVLTVIQECFGQLRDLPLKISPNGMARAILRARGSRNQDAYDEHMSEQKLEFTKLKGPEGRIYHYPDGHKLTIPSVTEVCVRPSGSHRLNTADGTKWIVMPGWNALELRGANEWTF